MCDAEFVTTPPTPFQWSQATHTWALQEAGFDHITWHPTMVAPEDVAHYREAYWQNFYANNFTMGLVGQK